MLAAHCDGHCPPSCEPEDDALTPPSFEQLGDAGNEQCLYGSQLSWSAPRLTRPFHALSRKPPWHPWSMVSQSMSDCAERRTEVFVPDDDTQIRSARDSTAANAQHEPQCPWLRMWPMDFAHPGNAERASKLAGIVSEDSRWARCGDGGSERSGRMKDRAMRPRPCAGGLVSAIVLFEV